MDLEGGARSHREYSPINTTLMLSALIHQPLHRTTNPIRLHDTTQWWATGEAVHLNGDGRQLWKLFSSLESLCLPVRPSSALAHLAPGTGTNGLDKKIVLNRRMSVEKYHK